MSQVVHLFPSNRRLMEYLESNRSGTVDRLNCRWIDDDGTVHLCRRVESEDDAIDLMALRPSSVVVHGFPWPLVHEALVEMRKTEAYFRL